MGDCVGAEVGNGVGDVGARLGDNVGSGVGGVTRSIFKRRDRFENIATSRLLLLQKQVLCRRADWTNATTAGLSRDDARAAAIPPFRPSARVAGTPGLVPPTQTRTTATTNVYIYIYIIIIRNIDIHNMYTYI